MLFVSRELSIINKTSLEQVRNAVETVLRETDSVALGLSTDPEFSSQASRVLTQPLRTIEDVKIRSSFLGTLKSAVNVRAYLRSLYVFIPQASDLIATSGDDIMTRGNFYDTAWIDSMVLHRSDLGYRIVPRLVVPYPGLSLRYRYLTLFRNMLAAGTLDYSGILVLNIDMGYLEQLMATYLKNNTARVFLLDKNGQILTTVGDQGFTDEGVQKAVAYQIKFEHFPFSLKVMVPQQEYYRLSITLALISIISSITALILGLGTAYAMSRRGFQSISAIVDIIDAANRGDPLPEPVIPIRNGYHDLVYSILKTFVERRFLKLQLSERELREKTLELLALQSQMNPHFLFNTLTSISCGALAFTNGPNSVTEMIDHLANLLAYSLGNPEGAVTMEDEVKYAQHYVAIQAHRYRDAFSVEWDIKPEVLEVPTTKLLFQPLIENAIYHGVRESPQKRHIWVSAKLEDADVVIQVSDDGVGMSADRLLEVRTWIDKIERPDEHIGLFNTVRRLRLRYGDAARVTIDSEEGKGTSITFRFPAPGTDGA